MLLRKINAGFSLLITFLLLDHAIFNSVWMLSQGSINKSADNIPWVLTGLMMIHAFISIDLAISGIMAGICSKSKKYPKLNLTTIIQRISGVVMIIFTALHVAGATDLLQPPKFVHATLPMLFFAVVLTHTAISASKALITLGIGNAKFIKTIDIAIKMICGITLIADVVGFYLFLV